jgi:lysophospholipase L1-like esterase
MGCPLVNGLLDYNCNGKLKFVFTGDSIVEGRVLSENSLSGGYVKYLSTEFPNIRFVNLGFWAITASELLGRFQSGTFDKRLRASDVVVIDVGRNECRDKVPPIAAFRTIKRLVGYISNFQKDIGKSPYVLVAFQIPNRMERRTCLEELNRILLVRKNNKDFPAHLRFDTLSETILSSDKIHPNTSGYLTMGQFAKSFIKNELQDLLIEDKPEIAPTE